MGSDGALTRITERFRPIADPDSGYWFDCRQRQRYHSIMITDMDKAVIVDLARKYRAKQVLLFGSSATKATEARDIDLGVEGIAPRDFFRFYADLLLRLSKPVDVIDLTLKSAFTSLVRRDGVPLYG